MGEGCTQAALERRAAGVAGAAGAAAGAESIVRGRRCVGAGA